MEKIKITEHAYDRGKDRLSLNRVSFEKVCAKAYELGISHSDTRGRINKYISGLYFQYKTANNIKVYGENVFLFSGNVLITVYQLPNEFKKYAKIFRKK